MIDFTFTEEQTLFRKAAKEFADMCIVYMAGLARSNLPPLSKYIADKLEINKARTWGPEIANGDRPRVK